ncbi:MAG: right-handed parallel beta-helix repeat-containing protein [Deltaproteobacteria bacterium]|nr:right-handed parallel beta-helix repeat-containing protein [Deltaproteobacteria bacterium]
MKKGAWLFVFILVLAQAGAALAQEVVVSDVQQLVAAVDAANGGGPKTIVLQDGTYSLDQGLWISAEGVTIRSASGNRDAVIIQGQGMYGGMSHVIWAAASNFTIRDLTLGLVANHAIQVHGDLDADNFTMANCRIIDCYEQLVKVSYNPDNTALGSDNGLVEGCLFEYTAGIGPQYYIGGIDAHNAKNWIVRNNIFIGIRSPADEVAEFAIHFWSNSENTLAEGNLIINCDRGIGFGLGDRAHVGGTIRNNMIYHDASEGFADVGIDLESTVGAQVYNNTIFQEHSYPSAIEYRWPASTGLLIVNNLTNRPITARDGATATVSNNVTSAQAEWFVEATAANLHLSSPVAGVVDQGLAIEDFTTDFDGNERPQGAGIDIGADEYMPET